jgi:hypothetical protein
MSTTAVMAEFKSMFDTGTRGRLRDDKASTNHGTSSHKNDFTPSGSDAHRPAPAAA